jgi:hypothetical protein
MFRARQIKVMTAMTNDYLRQRAERASRESYDSALSEVPDVVDEPDGMFEEVALVRAIQEGEATEAVSRADVLGALKPRGDE